MIHWPELDGPPELLKGHSLEEWPPARSVFHALQASAAVHGERTALTFLTSVGGDDSVTAVTYAEIA